MGDRNSPVTCRVPIVRTMIAAAGSRIPHSAARRAASSVVTIACSGWGPASPSGRMARGLQATTASLAQQQGEDERAVDAILSDAVYEGRFGAARPVEDCAR